MRWSPSSAAPAADDRDDGRLQGRRRSCLVLLVPIGGQVGALLLAVAVGALLSALVLRELRATRRSRPRAVVY